ncbi:MAG: hypothetical protein AAFR40_11565, partial [Pseudomonadota bacterium]
MLFELRDISFGYPTRPPVLHDASMTLDAGERLCITGANGAGKSKDMSRSSNSKGEVPHQQ